MSTVTVFHRRVLLPFPGAMRISAAFLLIVSIFYDRATRTTTAALDLDLCNSPLGMESRAINDSSVTASSAYDAASVGPQNARLRLEDGGGAWCPRHTVSTEAREYLQIDFGEVHVITATLTQGRFGNGQGQEYAEEYLLEYWRPDFSKWRRWKNRTNSELLVGNINTFLVVRQDLDPPIIASKIRFIPYSIHVRTICMRVEVVGCLWKDGLLSYSTMQGFRRGPGIDLLDRSYDGVEEGGRLSRGLGQLVDGRLGHDNFRHDYAQLGKGYEWVGWRNESTTMAGRPVELVMEFDKVRNFTALHLHANNMFSKDVQVFSQAKIYFSMDGSYYYGSPVVYNYMPDLVLEHARDVTIRVHNRIGRYVKVHLYFASRWILISEISTESSAVKGNFTRELLESLSSANQVPGDDFSDYTFQRDDVKTSADKTNGSGSSRDNGGKNNADTERYIGYVIGLFTVVIVILVAIILWIVIRSRRLKEAVDQSSAGRPFTSDKHVTFNMKVALGEDPMDKPAVMYHEPFQTNHYVSNDVHRKDTSDHFQKPCNNDIAGGPNFGCREYAVPHVTPQHSTFPNRAKEPPVLEKFFPKPPSVPPPTDEQFYAATEICHRPGSSQSPGVQQGGRYNSYHQEYQKPYRVVPSSGYFHDRS